MAIETFASFPSSRREGPSNIAVNLPRVVLPTTGNNLILPEDQARASFLIRNESETNAVRIYYDSNDFNNGTSLRPGESLTLLNVKNDVFGRSTGSGPATISITETRT